MNEAVHHYIEYKVYCTYYQDNQITLVADDLS